MKLDVLRRFTLTFFSVLLALGAVLGLTWVVYESAQRRQQISLSAGFFVLLSALISGRAAYVSLNWEYFQDQIFEIPQVWLGGLAWPGALAGAIFGTIIVAWISEIPVGVLVDRLCLWPRN